MTERILLTGHSHQAWPDVAFEAQKQAFLDAAQYVDDKWNLVFEKVENVKRRLSKILKDKDGGYSFASSTHELLVRFLSSLNLKNGAELITTDREFHTVYRQLRALEALGIKIHWVDADPVETLSTRILEKLNQQTRAVIVSAVFFNSGLIYEKIKDLAVPLKQAEIPLVIDVYHALNATDFDLVGLENAFVLGGGYKYLQMGEGVCFLRYPMETGLRPLVSGWMADFESVSSERTKNLTYQKTNLFGGATFDPVSFYRASKVFEFFDEHGLSPRELRRSLIGQTGRILERAKHWRTHGIIPIELSPEKIGGFVALKTTKSAELHRILKDQGIYTDFRADVLRLGPAPYVSDRQIDQALDQLEKLI
ncbi:MAG: aminotransferase class V-fold PLP-dependent enzyme [Oligoflexia bacterium]|nr:aminotransferase class V-fold PLP-dependent enzyme [Oligoflexia bacterium]